MFNILCIYTTAGRNINQPLTNHFIHIKDTPERRSKESAVLKLSAEVISKEGIQPACNWAQGGGPWLPLEMWQQIKIKICSASWISKWKEIAWRWGPESREQGWFFFMAAKLKFLWFKSWLIDLTEKPLAIFSLSVMGQPQEGKSLFSLFQSIKIG